MEMLLQISVTPARYELEIERARLEYKQDFQPRAEVNTTAPALKIETKRDELHLDTYEARKSLGITNSVDSIRQAADRGRESVLRAIGESGRMGEQLSKIYEGMTIADVINQKISQMRETFTAFLPSGGADISWEPGNIRMDYQKGNTKYNWKIKSNEMSYVPGSVRLRVIEQCKVDIKYVGGPLYFPPSAAPDYKKSSVG